MTTRDVELLDAAVTQHLPDPTSWAEPVHFPHSLALCALNSIYSLNAKSKQGENVLARYRAHRQKQNAIADQDHTDDMVDEINRYGPEVFAEKILNNKRTLSGGLLRTAGLQEALQKLMDSEVNTIQDLHKATAKELKALSREWQSVQGLGPASWDYFLMNAGLDGVKVDVRIRRFFVRSVGESSKSPSDERIKAAFEEVAKLHGKTRRCLDRAVWIYESKRK